uniref:Uncharacterized protein n=1 Tax=Romanomermis culicivorax TaxID=13658 RepID=A0A915JFS1_ROMCU
MNQLRTCSASMLEDVFGEAMIGAAREWEGWCKHRETLRGWTLLISFIVDRMRQGYEQAVKRPPPPAPLTHQYSVKPSASHRAGSIDGTSTSLQQPLTVSESSPSSTEASNEKNQHFSPPLTPYIYRDVERTEECGNIAKNPSGE